MRHNYGQARRQSLLAASRLAALASPVMIGVLLLSSVALAGRGGSTAAIEAAVRSGSVDAIVAELERAEFLACTSCIDPVRKLVDHSSPRVRDAAGWWLGRRGVRKEILASMTARFSAQDPIAARNAADVLAGMRDHSAMAPLMSYIKSPLDEESGAAAARALGAIGHPKALPALSATLTSSLAGVKVSALAAVRNLRAPVGAKVVSDGSEILSALNDADARVRREAVLTLGHLQSKAAVTPLQSLVSGDPSPLVRKAAAWALGEIGDASSGAVLTTAAQNDADPLVRSIARAANARLK